MQRPAHDESGLDWKDIIMVLAVIALLAAALRVQVANAAPPHAQPTVTDVLDGAAALYQKQDYAGARREFERATQLDPGSIQAWRGLGSSLWQLGEHEHALQVWNDILKVRPEDPDILGELGNVEASQEHWDAALALYDRVLKQKPKRASVMVAKARVNFLAGLPEAAEPDLRRALQLEPRNVEAQYLLAQVFRATNRTEEAEQIYERLAKQGGGTRYPREMADVYLDVDRPADAVPLYKQSVAQNPDSRGAVLGLARAHARLHEYGPAVDGLQAYLDKHPDDDKIREELARFENSAGDYDRAEQNLRTLVQAHPDEGKWRVTLAQVVRNEGRLDDARQMANEILADDPDNIPCLEILLHVAMMSGRKPDVAAALERLAQADPTARRWNRVGQAYITIGDELALKDKVSDAKANFLKAGEAFQHAADADPINADAKQGVITAQRLAGNYGAAIAGAKDIVARWPSVEWGWRELYEAELERNDYAEASRYMKEWIKRSPASVRARQEMARARFKKGEREQAIADLKAMLKEPLRPSVPVLLYHGLSEASPADDTMPLKNFRDQMQALKDSGYTPITMEELWEFYAHNAKLPARPILITFDDARADSYRYADPVLKEVGFKATMFTPVSEVGHHGDFNAMWPDLRQMRASGRWDIQCHSWYGHSMMPINADGAGGIFLANRQWLDDKQRLESRAEFTTRLDEDYRACATELRKQLPGLKLIGYAYPFGEMGQKSLSNEPRAVEINAMLVEKYYHIGFVQDDFAEVTRNSPPAALPRYEVPWDFTGKDLVHHLRSIDTYASTQMALADLYSWDGRYADARKVLDEVRAAGAVDDATVLVRRGEIAMWEGDFAGARRDMVVASELRASEQSAHGVAEIDRHTRPRFAFDGEGSADNHERRSAIGGPQQEVHLTDRIALSAAARYRLLTDEAFDQRRIDPAYVGGPVALRTNGGEAEAELAYRWNWRTMLLLGGGAAKFNDDSSAPLFAQPPDNFSLRSVELDVPIGDLVDVSLRGRRSYVPAAGAVLSGLQQTSREARVQDRLTRDTLLEGRYMRTSYSDGNSRDTALASVMERLTESPEFQVGYRFRYDDTAAQNPYFYTPSGFIGNDAVLKLVAHAAQYHSFELEAAGGYGKESGAGQHVESTLLGTWRFELPDRFTFYLGGGRDQAAEFSSVGVTLGLAWTF